MKNKRFLYIIILLNLAVAELHDDRIIDIIFSHDNQYYVTGSKDGKVIMWDNETDKIESIFSVDSGKVITKKINIILNIDRKLAIVIFFINALYLNYIPRV